MAEITETSTTEEVSDYVEEVVQEVAAERAGTESTPETTSGDGESPKGDARLASEHADNEKPTAALAEEGTEVSEDTASLNAGETTGEETSGQEWLDDDLRAELTAHGIVEEQLADFQSREEVERALRFFDKSALDAGRKALAETDGEPESQTRNEKGQFEKKEPPAEKPPVEGAYEIGLDEDVYDEELVGEFTKMRDHYETRLNALEERFGEVSARAEEQHFDMIVDSLGHKDLFGTTGKENSKQLERRQDLIVQAKAMQVGLRQLGQDVDLDESLVSRVAKMVFAEDLGKKERKALTRKVSRQSNGRQGGGATRPQDPMEDPREEADRRYKELAGLS